MVVPATVLIIVASVIKSSNKPGNTKKQTVGRKLTRRGTLSPPVRGGQRDPQPVLQRVVAEDSLLQLPCSGDVLPLYFSQPVKSEIKVSTLKPALFYLKDGKIFNDKHLPDPVPTFLSRLNPNERFTSEYFIGLHSLVAASGFDYPANTYNFDGARIPLSHTKLNIPKWKELLATYPKKDILDKLEFGFPIGISKEPDLEPSLKNHSSSYLFYSWLDKFCIKEIQHCGLTGPFGNVPFSEYHISPMMTSHKKPDKRRCVFDATFGMSLNKSTPKEFYLEERTEYDFPSLDDFQDMIVKVGRGSRMWKRDLSNYFLQIPICPLEYPKTGFIWRTNYFFFVSYMFGLRHSGLAGQSITSAVSWIHRNKDIEYNILNYSDDLAGVEEGEKADVSFEKVGLLLAELGLDEASDKATAPSTTITYLGVTFDSISFKKTVPPEKIAEILDLLMKWSTMTSCTKRSLQSLCGKLLWVARCVRHSRVFLSRLLTALKTMASALPYHKITLSEDMRLDILWWLTYMRHFNGVNFIIDPSVVKLSYKGDACLDGGGGYHLLEYWSRPLPEWMLGKSVPIHQKEFWVLLVSINLWGATWTGQAVELFVDNTAVCQTCVNQKPSDTTMAKFLREFLYLVVHFKFLPIVSYIGTKENFVADYLSRKFDSEAAKVFFRSHNLGDLVLRQVPNNMFSFSANW